MRRTIGLKKDEYSLDRKTATYVLILSLFKYYTKRQSELFFFSSDTMFACDYVP